MSWIKCHDCDRPINSDDHPECWVEIGNMRRQTETIALCEACKDEREREAERDDWRQAEQEPTGHE